MTQLARAHVATVEGPEGRGRVRVSLPDRGRSRGEVWPRVCMPLGAGARQHRASERPSSWGRGPGGGPPGRPGAARTTAPSPARVPVHAHRAQRGHR